MQFTIIEKHPLRDAYCLFAPITSLPPYIGSLKECKRMQTVWENKLSKEFDKLPQTDKQRILTELTDAIN